MSTETPYPPFHFKNVTNRIDKFFEPAKPDGFRFPGVYFSWATLEYSRKLHSHPDADEMALFLSGEAEVGIWLPTDNDDETCDKITFNVSAGDVVLFPQGYPHYIKKNPDNEESKFIAIFNNPDITVTPLE